MDRGIDELVERIARAIFEQQNRVSIFPNKWESDPNHWRGMARAAVEATNSYWQEVSDANPVKEPDVP